MRAFVLFIVGLVLGACGTHTEPLVPRAPTHVDGAIALRAVTVAIVQVDEDRLHPVCSGVWVSEASILTARHCVSDSELGDVELYIVHDDVYPAGLGEASRLPLRIARLSAADDAHDLALIRAVSAPIHVVAHTRLAPIVQGLPVQAMGHSLGLWYSYSTGVVSAVRARDLDDGVKLWVQTTAPTSPGNSGGGLFDEDAALVGVCHGTFADGQVLNLYTHVSYVDALLAAARAGGSL